MADKVLIYSRFPKTMMARFAERFELLDTAASRRGRCFRRKSSVASARLLTAGGTPARCGGDGPVSEAGRDRLLRHRL